MGKLIIHTDGGARGNPGEAAIGVYIQDEKEKVLAEIGKTIGRTTNNVAEYKAVIEALKWIIDNKHVILASEARPESILKKKDPGHTEIKDSSARARMTLFLIEFYLDSTLVAQQLNRVFQIKLPHLKDLALKVWELESEINVPISYHIVRREQNKEADRLVNEALDKDNNMSSRA